MEKTNIMNMEELNKELKDLVKRYQRVPGYKLSFYEYCSLYYLRKSAMKSSLV